MFENLPFIPTYWGIALGCLTLGVSARYIFKFLRIRASRKRIITCTNDLERRSDNNDRNDSESGTISTLPVDDQQLPTPKEETPEIEHESQTPIGEQDISHCIRRSSLTSIHSEPEEESIIRSPSCQSTLYEPESLSPSANPSPHEVPPINDTGLERNFSLTSSSNATSIRTGPPFYQEDLPENEQRIAGGPLGGAGGID
ncbi:hypothetical protein QCA50_007182 [Cerrena zonata]|uniref:Uncharacterized protein n=1 Tax=Cerrena zonata TaxID=2478898 RepID=A0AAW0GE19_9APHY